MQAEAVAWVTGESTVKGLWFSFLPKAKSILSDNGSHFTAGIVQEWAKTGGMLCVFHTPYYPQVSWIVERTNGCLNQILRPQDPK